MASVFFAWIGIRQVSKWSKVNATASFINSERADSLLDNLDKELTRLSLPLIGELSLEEITKILADPNATKALIRYLSYFEKLAAVINIGAVDEELVYQFAVGDFINVWKRYKFYILQKREINKDSEVMLELQNIVNRWKTIKIDIRNDSNVTHKNLGLGKKL